ncbi:hypothetical protein L249_0643 [Ophiocordyceps polyrhachis-furcata BCC 54312]|uniref:3CxxC-type domain-containing protein n=1 Tax=Ophiocordyceps polyrhachis-furcata BCC 54312 TaxID=1330021 RepID=A0A367LFG1_9HYPO|nr:hypothetical protein L249_0643 [Ophiocordyceps polyrhachis-furcata BCC 54312]
MAPNGGKKRGKQQKKWALYPDLHEAVTTKLEQDGIVLDFNHADDEDCLKHHNTNIKGRFLCRNNKCSNNGWGSSKIAVTIRLYKGSSYNARVYYQRCRGCNGRSKPFLDSSYADRVVYRMRKWHGREVVERLPGDARKGPPHEGGLCEGCIAGVCAGGGS